jgi:uncharacterized damage-inducible protein DinB
MASTATATPADLQAVHSPKQQFLDAFEREHATTLRVLRSYPADKLDLRPHARCKTARELATVFSAEAGLIHKALTTGFDWSATTSPRPAPPDKLETIIADYETAHGKIVELVRRTPDERLYATIKFPVAPKTIGDWKTLDFLWMMLHDQIHHRGQFSIYLRMADAKVPSIYGPSADEPWM